MKISIVAAAAILLGSAALGVGAQETSKERIINGGVLNGKATSMPKPEYPGIAQANGKGGAVNVDVVIDEAGTVISAVGSPAIRAKAGAEGMKAERDEIDPSLVEAAENAAKQARFAPTLLSGVPVKIKGTITYNFVPDADGSASDPEIKGGVLNSRTVSMPKPAYPPAALAVRAEGAVSVMVKVDEEGKVTDAQAVSGHPLLRAAAVKAALEAKFNPTMLDGKPVQVAGVLVYNFVADKSDQ